MNNLDRFRGKLAVVTGASAGIGVEIVRKLFLENINVIGLARRVECVEDLANKWNKLNKGKIYAIKCDVTNEKDVLNAFDWIETNLGPIHILINNAGILKNTTLIDGDYQIWKQTLDTNLLGLCLTTKQAVKIMKNHNIAGHIININSIAGHKNYNFPNFNTYTASKFGVTAVTESLRYELRCAGLRIKTTSLSPSFVETDMVRSNDVECLQTIKPEAILSKEDLVDVLIYVLSTPPNVQIKELVLQAIDDLS